MQVRAARTSPQSAASTSRSSSQSGRRRALLPGHARPRRSYCAAGGSHSLRAARCMAGTCEAVADRVDAAAALSQRLPLLDANPSVPELGPTRYLPHSGRRPRPRGRAPRVMGPHGKAVAFKIRSIPGLPPAPGLAFARGRSPCSEQGFRVRRSNATRMLVLRANHTI